MPVAPMQAELVSHSTLEKHSFPPSLLLEEVAVAVAAKTCGSDQVPHYAVVAGAGSHAYLQLQANVDGSYKRFAAFERLDAVAG